MRAATVRSVSAFGRRLNALVERLFLAVVWRNFVKGRSERKPDRTTPAMKLGLTDRPWKWKRLLGRRLLADRERVDPEWMRLYRRDWPTPELPTNTSHRLILAY